MNNTLISLITSVLVTVPLVLGLSYCQGNDEIERLAAQTAELKKAETNNTLSMTDLYNEVRGIRGQLRSNVSSRNQTDSSESSEGYTPEEILERLELLEDAVHKLSPKYSVDKSTDRGFRKQLSDGDYQSGGMSDLSRRAFAENEFESDSGVPLDEYADSVERTVRENTSIDVKGLECRTSMCKVTLSKSDSSNFDQDDSRSEMVDQLVSGANGKEVEIRYASDAYGNDVMYVQLR